MKTQYFKVKFYGLVLNFFLLLIIFLSFSCEKEKSDPVFQVSSLQGHSLLKYSFSIKIESLGDYEIFDYGYVYYIRNENSFYNQKTVSLGSDIESEFSDTLTLNINSFYNNYNQILFKAYITNEKGTIFSKEVYTDIVKVNLKTISPAVGKPGDTLTLTGIYFDPIPVNNRVKFDNSVASVIAGTRQELKVIVPSASSYYSNNIANVSVEADGIISTLIDAFTYLPGPESFSPHSGTWNTYITIYGIGLLNAGVYFDDVYITSNNYSSSYFDVNIPYSFLKKQFKIYVLLGDQKIEVPGGYFKMSDLTIDALHTYEYALGSTIHFYGSYFHPSNSYNILMLGEHPIFPIYSASSYAGFNIPVNFATGTYVATITNGIDTITLSNPITIVAK